MSSDFYFNKWKENLRDLKELVDTDVHYQVTRAHDQTLSQAVHRLSSVLGRYMLMYNQIIECFNQNLQVQKTAYMDHVVKAVVSRILELKHTLEKLEGSRFQFIGHGLTEVHETVFDIDMRTIPMEVERPEHIQADLEAILARVREKKEALAKKESKAVEVTIEEVEPKESLWEVEVNIKDLYAKKKKTEIPEELRKTREYLAMILAHEKTRQVTRAMKVSQLKREMWEKELNGTLKSLARYEIRQKSADLMQKVFRAYFELKRERIKTCKRDEILGLNVCENQNKDAQRKQAEEIVQNRSKRYKKYEKEWLAKREDLKEHFLKEKRDQFCEDWREQIRQWFYEWFESIQFFHNIPKDGSAPIFNGEVPSPLEWKEENEALAIKKEADKKKSPQDLKFEKMEAKRQAKLLKKEEQTKMKADALLLRKMMKNPTMHPGYHYPLSKRTNHLLEVINQYHKSWDMYDSWESIDAKEKYVKRVDVEQAIMEAKLEVLPKVDEQMSQELQQLKRALKEDYARNEEEMPVDVTKPIKGEKKKKHIKLDLTERVAEMVENLAVQGFITEYSKMKIEDFIGDPNFGGEDLRRQILPAFPFNFEIRSYWCQKCREVSHGFHRILLVGPKTSGKTILVQALASVNNAVLFVLDPFKLPGALLSGMFLKRLVHNVVTCARALQPSVIRIKHMDKLFYSKVPPEEAEMNLPLIGKFFVQKLLKKIHKTDNITVIGTCTEPWLSKSSTLLKQFPVVLVLPDSTYSLVVQMLKDWVIKYKTIPADFNVSNLAKVLQGYAVGYLKEALDKFMSADRLVKIDAFGLTPMEVYDYILEDESESKIEYDKYLKWYSEKTSWGKKEMQHLEDQRQFKAAVEKYAAKNKKAKSAHSTSQ